MGDHGGGASGSQYRGRLELTWTNKDQALLWSEDGSYRWVSPADYRIAEVRLLHEAGEVGEVGPLSRRAADNLLIRGDALNALTSLARIPEFQRHYLGKVKLAYLDPPFNTQQAFEHYDDALEHSVWLTMMRDRLVQIKRLLREDGSVWVHLDQREVHYAKIVMDEVFGRANFAGEVIWRAADSSNNDAKQFSVDHNTLLVYGQQPGWLSTALPRNEDDNSHYRNPDNDVRGPWFPGNVSSPNPRDNLRFVIDASFGWKGTPIPPPANGWRWQESTMHEKIESGEVVLHEDEPGKPRLLRKTYLADQLGLAPSSLWDDIEVTGHNRQAKYELKKLFPGLQTAQLFKTPKPERLLRRVLQVASSSGDIVLDCFLGSGTTAAVAHKLGRRWVGVERSADALTTFAIPRLEKVVTAHDPGGITSAVGWRGGGGFRILDVAPSMFVESRGAVVLAEWAVNGQLAEATAAQLGYEFRFDPPFCGNKGRSLLAVVDGLITSEVVELIAASLEPSERVVICGTAVAVDADGALKAVSPGSRVRRIPASILADYRLATRRFFHSREIPALQPNLDPNGSPMVKPPAEAAHS
jgi:adenine-specific DNA-methyltransferase